jgi:hypothetical protein
MLAEGRINADDAERLLDALENESPPEPHVSTEETGKKCKTLHIIVHDHPGHESDRERVHVKIPMVMLKAGMKFSKLMPDKILDKINSRLSEKGINMDEMNFNKLDNILEALKEGSIDIENGDEKVHIFCE